MRKTAAVLICSGLKVCLRFFLAMSSCIFGSLWVARASHLHVALTMHAFVIVVCVVLVVFSL